MPLPTDLGKAEEAKRRANEQSTKPYDLVGLLCPACNEPVTICEPNPNEYIHDENEGTYGNDRAAYEFSPKRLHDADPDNPWNLIHVVPERVEKVDDSHQLQVIAYKHDHSTDAYRAWKRELDELEEHERRAEENHGLDGFDYGDRKPDGQFENYPTIDEGELQQEVRETYTHEECGTRTTMTGDLPVSVARDPEYYTRTFCSGCGEHVPVEQVVWDDGEDWVVDDE